MYSRLVAGFFIENSWLLTPCMLALTLILLMAVMMSILQDGLAISRLPIN